MTATASTNASSNPTEGRTAAETAELVEPTFEQLAGAVDEATLRVNDLEGDAHDDAVALKEAVEAFHRPALVHIVRTLKDDPRGKELLFELVDDPAVKAIFGLHGIIRADPMTRANQALLSVRPYLQSHGGDVDLVRIEDGAAFVRLQGSCNGCSMSAVTLREGVEAALVEGVEEVDRVEVLDDEPTAAFIPLSSIGRKQKPADTGWIKGPQSSEVEPGSMLRFDVTGNGGQSESFVVTNIDNRLSVFRNACVHQGMTLDGGMIDDGIIVCPWHGFKFEASSGECISAPGAQLEQIPTRVEDGFVWVPAGCAVARLWLGAEAAGGLTLPDAMPTASQMYAPRGVWLDDEHLIVADTGNHRVLIWNNATTLQSHSNADVVLGQPDFTTEGAQAGGRGAEKGMRLPTGIIVHEGRLVVADAWNHRILIWNAIPTVSDTAPNVILGQANGNEVEENRGGDCGPLTFYWPFGIAIVGDTFYVADTGNRRVLGWHGIPGPEDEPDLVLGQPDANSRDENRGELGPNSFRWPHDIAGTNEITLIADAGNHRILGWKPTVDSDRPADTVLGQTDFVSGAEFPYAPQTPTALRFPYAVDIDDDTMVAADTANNRVLVWDHVPSDSTVPADRVLGQPNFAANGENRWDEVGPDTFCWPYGLSLHAGRVAVTDSGNNRVTVWDL